MLVGPGCADEQQVLAVSSVLRGLDKVLARSYAHRWSYREEYQLRLHIIYDSRVQLMAYLPMCGSKSSDVVLHWSRRDLPVIIGPEKACERRCKFLEGRSGRKTGPGRDPV